MMGTDATRSGLKTQLKQRVEALGIESAIFPSSGEPIDEIVQQLENINPRERPLQPQHRTCIIGDWELIYASRGTVVTRRLASLPNLGGVKIKRVWQSLAGDREIISTSNAALLSLPLLGECKVQADGVWNLNVDETVANVSFDAFSLQAIKPFGISNWNFPELKIPVLEFLRNEALWKTSYLNEEIRVGRGASGNLFVFKKGRRKKEEGRSLIDYE